ncbi:MAG TPA: ATP-binding protein [Thermoanaerobaculia bacterium]|nr:ATP-binding protein [Thermoanaerobaculia bacterium]
MVSGARPALTKIGFRRDVKLFLALLIGFLVVLILTLVTLLQVNVRQTEEAVAAQWELTGDVAADSLGDGIAHGGVSASDLAAMRARYSLTAIEVRRPGQQPITSGYPGEQAKRVARRAGDAEIVLWFDDAPIRALQRRFVLTATIVLLASVISTLLMLQYLPKIVRPIEEMLDHARQLDGGATSNVDETTYLIDTFRSSIATLKDQEAELKRLHEREKIRADDLARVTATLTRNLTSGFIAVDAEGRIVDLNAAAREILRLPATPLAGVPLREALGDSAFADALARSYETRETLARHEVSAGDGAEARVIGLTTVPLFNESEQFLGMLALFSDLTPVRQLETRLRESQTLAELGEISAGIAHEFRNSLSTILGYLKLARRAQNAEATIDAITKAEKEAGELAGAVAALLTFARPLQLDSRTVALGPFLDALSSRIGAETGVEIRCGGDDVTIPGDAALLARAFENLIRNAAESVRAKGTGSVDVRIAAEPQPSVTIVDDGTGLDTSDVPRLFLPFQSDRPGGYGLGLPLARKIVLLHGGSIDLTGAVGRGATVTVTLPC